MEKVANVTKVLTVKQLACLTAMRTAGMYDFAYVVHLAWGNGRKTTVTTSSEYINKLIREGNNAI